jgi:hypothetical protein
LDKKNDKEQDQSEFLELRLSVKVGKREPWEDKVRERRRLGEKKLEEEEEDFTRGGSLVRMRIFLNSLLAFERTLRDCTSSSSSSSSKTDGRVPDWQGGHKGATLLGIR